jgi:C_GCAxxG_C_C family probable redox protein
MLKLIRKNKGSSDAVLATFGKGYNCAQAMLSEYGPELGLDRETALRVSGAFGGGMGKTGNICGVVTGALMVIGLKCASIDAKDKKAKKKTEDTARRFISAFESKNGSIVCRELLGCDIGSPEAEKQKKRIKEACRGFVRYAVDLVDNLLNK